MPRCGTGLADLVELGHKGKDGLILSGRIDEGLAAAKRRGGIAQKIQEERFDFGLWPPACFLVQPAPATKSNLAFG